jgi:hypothetical protein
MGLSRCVGPRAGRRAVGPTPRRWLFVSGCVANQATLYQRFDAVVLLSAPVDVILARVGQRDNPYGSRAEDGAKIQETWLRSSRCCAPGSIRRSRRGRPSPTSSRGLRRLRPRPPDEPIRVAGDDPLQTPLRRGGRPPVPPAESSTGWKSPPGTVALPAALASCAEELMENACLTSIGPRFPDNAFDNIRPVQGVRSALHRRQNRRCRPKHRSPVKCHPRVADSRAVRAPSPRGGRPSSPSGVARPRWLARLR